ncbi:MAG: 50S ribosomal protein L17 [Verrucomicrobiota bacterium]
MRHQKHRHQLGVKKAHRGALMANLATALFTHGRIQTTLAKAKALRPFSEKLITLAVKANATDDTAKKLHLRRLALARVRDKAAVKLLFDERVSEFTGRSGGYTRIYKLVPRLGDAADMAIIELIAADDEGYDSKPKRKAKKAKKPAAKPAEATEEATEAPAAVADAEAPAEEVTEAVEAEAKADAEPTAEAAPAEEAHADEAKAEDDAPENEDKK